MLVILFSVCVLRSVSVDLLQSAVFPLALAQSLKKFPAFMKPEGSLSCSQERKIGPYPEPDDSSPYTHPISAKYILI
jgi:hypothetical protein